MIRWFAILCIWKLRSKPKSKETLYTEGLFQKSCLWKSYSETGFRRKTIHGRTFSEIVSIKIEIRRRFSLSIADLLYTISEWEHPYLFCLSIFDFRQEIHIHDFWKKHRVSSRYCSNALSQGVARLPSAEPRANSNAPLCRPWLTFLSNMVWL